VLKESEGLNSFSNSILVYETPTSEDNTTRYWREQKEKGKLQITEELNSGLRKTKVGCCNK
jgi:hypothetical protein